jgi:hypothetical protein
VADGDLAGAHVAGKVGESEAAADIPPQVNDQAAALLLFEIDSCFIQCFSKSHPCRTGKVGDFE